MKQCSLFLAILLAGTVCHAQILKKIGNRVKDDLEWKASHKVGQKVDQGLDSLLAIPKKVNAKKKTKDQTKTGSDSNSDNPSNKSAANDKTGKNGKETPAKEAELGTTDGHITLKLSSAKTFAGGSILITGESVKYKNYNQVELKVSGPGSTDTRNLTLTADGKYSAAWNASEKTGEYKVTVTSSDKKSTQVAGFTVEEIELVFDDDWPEDNKREMERAVDNLEDAVDKVKGNISAKNKADLESRMGELKKDVDDIKKFYKDLGKANKELGQLVKKGKKLPPNLAANLSELNNNLATQADQLKQMNDVAEHQAQDNTICEYLVMVNEACAAFSTFTNIWAKSVSGLVKNIMLDKAVPKVAGAVNEAAGGISAPYDFPLKEAAKIYATSKFDAESLTERLGKAGVAGDILQFTTDVLFNIYCESFTGKFTHDYTIKFRNEDGEDWWRYGATMQGALSLRFPKSGGSSSIIKMKGNLEGNATKFTFFEDVAREDEFKKGTQGKIEIVPIKTFTPLAVSFSTAERDILGFGAIARGLATPAYFNIPIDAEYDVDANKIKIFVNEALVDFLPYIANQFVFILYGGDLIPHIKKMTFPIHQARLTINAVMMNNNEFTIKKDAKGNLSFDGKGNRHIGDEVSVRETDLNFTISARKE